MADWQGKYTKLLVEFDDRVAATRRFLDRYAAWLLRYKGGLHVGFFAAIAQWESGGRMDSPGDSSLGEYGFFQIARSTEETFGVPEDFRKTPEGNIFLAGLEYNVEARRLALGQDFVRTGSRDQWLLARLVFAIGRSGTNRLLKAAGESGFLGGAVYEGLIQYIDETGGMALGSQSAGKVWLRVKIVPVLFDIGVRAFPNGTIGPPMQVTSPPAVAYRLPKDVRDQLPTEATVALASVGALVAGLFLPGV